MKIKEYFVLVCHLFSGLVLANLGEVARVRERRALYSQPSGHEEIKRVVRIETFYSADRVTDVDFCTGVLLNESIVLTAAHCIYRGGRAEPIGYAVFGNGIMVGGGVYVRHPAYTYGRLDEMPTNAESICTDVALLFLRSPIPLNLTPRSPKLVVDCGKTYKSTKCASHGAGITESGKLSSKILRVPLPKIHFSRNVPFNSNACFEATYMAKERLCQGDSGGPVICSLSENVMSVIGVSVQVISYDAPKNNSSTTETCKISFGSIVTNTVSLMELIRMLPPSLKEEVKEGVNFKNCGSF